MHTMKAAEMNEWGIYLFKLAVMRDIFEIKEIGASLRGRTDFTYSDAAVGQYLKSVRQPPPNFFDYVREALELTEEEYQTLLFLYHRSKPSPSPVQQQQMSYFKTVLLERMVENLRGGGHREGVGTAS